MTDKELRKLSRLELLELLLEAGKENEKLKEQINRLKLEKEIAQNIENLSVITHQVETVLEYANNISDILKTASANTGTDEIGVKKGSAADTETVTQDKPLSDVEIYKSMLRFFANNDEKLSVFPPDTENAVRARIKSILEKR